MAVQRQVTQDQIDVVCSGAYENLASGTLADSMQSVDPARARSLYADGCVSQYNSAKA